VKRAKILILLTIAILVVLVSSFFAASNYLLPPANKNSKKSGFYMGVQCGYSNVTLCKALIDKVKGYTNFFIIGSTEIAMNASLLNEVCDYAYNAGLHFSVYFSAFLSYTTLGETNVFVTLPNGTSISNSTVSGLGYQSPLPLDWLRNAASKYKDRFLGAYVFDEPAGNQLDGSKQRVVSTANDCQSAANAFRGNVSAKIEPYLDANLTVFTSDYGLYWFDYESGYNFLLAELGGINCNRQMQISLCRGAANVQGKDWGTMITHISNQEQFMESGPNLYDDLVLSYDSGAKYAVVFDYAETNSPSPEALQPYEYGILQEEHFEALKNFWSYVQQNPAKQGSLKADVAFVLPMDFGFGLRGYQDSIWGIFSGNSTSQGVWAEANTNLNQYGSRLDIVYDDLGFNGDVAANYTTRIYSSTVETR
jgi:hypothetical protein